MEFVATPLPGVFVVESQAHGDERGSFRRAWCADSFAAAGMEFRPVQASISNNIAVHTLRGMHWQAEPYGEQKLVRCVAGAVVEYLIDTPHVAQAGRGARWNDPGFGIEWPAVPVVMSDRDRDWPDFVR